MSLGCDSESRFALGDVIATLCHNPARTETQYSSEILVSSVGVEVVSALPVPS